MPVARTSSGPTNVSPWSQETWQMCKALFICGQSLESSADSTGISRTAVLKRAQREGWTLLRLHLSEAQIAHSKAATEDSEMLALSSRLKGFIASDLERSVMNLRKAKLSGSVQGLTDRAILQEKLVRVCSDVFGWKQQALTSAINIAVLTGAKQEQRHPVTSTPVSHSAIIDVTSSHATCDDSVVACDTTVASDDRQLKESLTRPAKPRT